MKDRCNVTARHRRSLSVDTGSNSLLNHIHGAYDMNHILCSQRTWSHQQKRKQGNDNLALIFIDIIKKYWQCKEKHKIQDYLFPGKNRLYIKLQQGRHNSKICAKKQIRDQETNSQTQSAARDKAFIFCRNKIIYKRYPYQKRSAGHAEGVID